MQRALLFATCLAYLPFLTGGVIPYAFPKLDLTQALALDAPPADVRVFRVDSTRGKADCMTVTVERLAEIPVSASGNVAPQIKPSVPAGVYLFMVALNYDFRLSKSLALRAYRSGFETVEIESWERINQVTWKPATDLAAQERAVDLLLTLEPDQNSPNLVTLKAGSSSVAHRAALLFGAAEYERLGKIAELPADRTRLAGKAQKLKERANL